MVADLILVRPMRKLLTVVAFALVAFASFAFGYFRGYSNHCRMLAAFRLRVDELLWRRLSDGQVEQARQDMRICIYSDAKAYRSVTSQPFRHFVEVYSRVHFDKMPQALAEADKITQEVTFETHDFSEATGD